MIKSDIYFAVKNPYDIPSYIEKLKNNFRNDNKVNFIYKKYNNDIININLYIDITRDLFNNYSNIIYSLLDIDGIGIISYKYIKGLKNLKIIEYNSNESLL